MNVKIKKAKRADALHVFENLRNEDFREVTTTIPFGTDMSEVLLAGWKASAVSYAITVDGETVAVLGLVSKNLVNMVWMLCTPGIGRAPKTILGRCKDISAKWYRRYGVLFCICDNRNDLHLRWLKLIGFYKQGDMVQGGQPFTHLLYNGGVPFAHLSQ